MRLLSAYLRKREEIFERGPGLETLPVPQLADEIEYAERALGVPLPDDLRALYAVADGDDGLRLFDRHIWLDLPQVVSLHHADHWWAADNTWKYHTLDSVRSDGMPRPTVRFSADRRGWIVFAESTGGDFLAVDMDPAEGGRPGQVIRVGMHHDVGPVYVADSVTELLRLHLAALERGDYRCDVAAEDGQLWIETGLPRRHGDTAHRDTADGGSDGVDAAAEAPVHHAYVTCDAELAPLAGHPTLAAVTVQQAETVEALSLAPLRNCPQLYGLDLSRAKVRDIEVLAGIPALRYLSMREEQWHELTEYAGRRSGLAAAVLADASSLETLAAWAASLDGDGDDIRYYTGRLPDHA
ncbi:SMI1/KNR4 family protein [Streptomyces violaceusniger]|uniref:SMI1/KNR4 family protein n=1 Tax=Streptomyces violaceusniger TaxID=68280 RepID=UPI003803DA8F